MPILFSYPEFKYKSNILNRPLGRVLFILKFVGRVGLGLLDIALGQEIGIHVLCCVSDVFWHHGVRQLDDGSYDGRCTVTQDNDGLCRLCLRNVRARDAGTYIVVAVNDAATCKQVFNVTVNSMY